MKYGKIKARRVGCKNAEKEQQTDEDVFWNDG